MPTIHSPAYIEFITRLRNARKSSKLSQAELASRLGKRQSFVAKVETCERRLDVIEAAQWCAALGTSLLEALPKDIPGIVPEPQHQDKEGNNV